MKILVTGGAGFIGSNLCKKLLELGRIVICLDDLSTGSRNNIQQFIKNKNFRFIEHNVIDPIDVESDLIYCLASAASPKKYQSDPIKTIKTNVIGSFNMLELAKKYKSKILFSSTSEIYGDPELHPQTENYFGNVNPIGIRACYDEAKRLSETIFTEYYRQYGVDTKIVRIFNTYGPNMEIDDGRVVSNFINQALNNQSLTIYGDGSQTRSFQYIDDLINGMILMMGFENFRGPLNLGNPYEYSIKNLAEKIIKLTNSESKIEYFPLPQDDPKKRKPDISLAEKTLNWEPKIKLEDGLIKTINYFKIKIN